MPENKSGEETVAVLSAEVPFPKSIPVSEVDPVPPPATLSVPDREGAKVIEFPAPVIVSADVRPFTVFVVLARLMAGPL